MAAVKNKIHDIRLIFGIGAAVIQFYSLKPHFFLKPVRIEIHRHGRTENHTVILHMPGHPWILAQLIIHQIRKILKGRMIVKKRVHINDKPQNAEKHYNNT